MPPPGRKDDEKEAQLAYYAANYGYGARDGTSDLEGGFALADLVGLLRRRWELVLGSVVIGTIVAAAWTYHQPIVYTAVAKILIEPEHRVVDLDSVVEGVGSDSGAIETQLNLLKSKSFLEEFIRARRGAGSSTAEAIRAMERLKAASNPENANGNATLASDVDQAAIDHGIGSAIGSEALSLAENVSVSQEGRSFIINVGYTSPDRNEAAETANELAKHYINDQVKRRREITGSASRFIEERLETLEAELLAAEQAVHEYRAENPSATKGGTSLTNERLSDISSLLVKTRAERKEKEARLDYMRQLRRDGGNLSSLTEVLNSPYVASLWEEGSRLRTQETELRLDLGGNHPRIVALNEEQAALNARIESETSKVIDNVTNELQVLIARENSLEKDLEEVSNLASETDVSSDFASIRLRLLEGKAETNRRIYQDFQVRLKETREQEGIVQANTRLVASAASPTVPSSTSPIRVIFLGFVGSSILGFGLAYLVEQADSSIKTGKDIGRLLGIPCLGLVPYLNAKHRVNLEFHEYIQKRPTSRFAESLRSIYTQLLISSETEEPPKVLQITSSLANEGKTTFATNLATMLALDGKKVLLIDLDLRNPSVHRQIDLSDANSFVPFLRGKTTFDKSMVERLDSGCDVIAAHTPAKDPGRLVRSRRLSSLIEQMREHYEFIIIDGPPSLGLSDCKVLLSRIDALLFVVRWKHTTSQQAQEAIEELRQSNANIIGAVLTQVDLKLQRRYGYTEAYGKESGHYYSD